MLRNKKITINKGNQISSWLPLFYFKRELFFQIEIKSSIKYEQNFNERLTTNRLFGVTENIFSYKQNSISIEYRYIKRTKEIQFYLKQYVDGRLYKIDIGMVHNRNIINHKIQCNIKFEKDRYSVTINNRQLQLEKSERNRFNIRRLLLPKLFVGKLKNNLTINVKYGLVKKLINTLY